MSIMVVQLAPAGLLFEADGNITSQLTLSDGSVEVVVTGQSARPKVLKWPNHEVIIGYVGQAELRGRPADKWLYYEFIGQHLQFGSRGALANALTVDLNDLLPDFNDEPMVLHLGGLEKGNGEWRPQAYVIRNTTGLPSTGYVVGKRFELSEEISDPKNFGAKPANQLRVEVAWPNYFSFRQAITLSNSTQSSRPSE